MTEQLTEPCDKKTKAMRCYAFALFFAGFGLSSAFLGLALTLLNVQIGIALALIFVLTGLLLALAYLGRGARIVHV